jgi:hypothetical protein
LFYKTEGGFMKEMADGIVTYLNAKDNYNDNAISEFIKNQKG